MLDVGDLVDLARSLAVPACPLIRVGDRLAGDLRKLPADLAEQGLLGHDIAEPGADAVGSGLEAGELGAHLEPLGEGGRDIRDDRLRRQSREHVENLLTCILDAAQLDQEVGPPGPDVDELALQVDGEIVEISSPRIQVIPKADQRGACDPDIDVTRRCDSLALFSPGDYRRTMKRRRTRS